MCQKKILIVSLLLVILQANAQETVATTGGSASGTNGNMSFTLGETLYNTNTGVNGSLSQGVQQPYEIQTTLGMDNFEINLQLAVYPNPTVNTLQLEVKNTSFSKLSYQLFDLNGRMICDTKITTEISIIDLQNLPTTLYVLKILENKKEVKIFKIIKK